MNVQYDIYDAVQSVMCVPNWAHYGLGVVFVFLQLHFLIIIIIT